jgi:hypothetical protein
MALRCEGARVRKDLRRQQFSADAVVCRCFLCRGQFQCGPGRYDGRSIPEWDIGVCDVCITSNWDGIMLGRYPHLVEHLKAKGIPIELNAKEWLDWPSPLMRRPTR